MFLSYSHLTREMCINPIWSGKISLYLSLSLTLSLSGVGIINGCAALIHHMHAELHLKTHGALFPLSLCAAMAWFIGSMLWSFYFPQLNNNILILLIFQFSNNVYWKQLFPKCVIIEILANWENYGMCVHFGNKFILHCIVHYCCDYN